MMLTSPLAHEIAEHRHLKQPATGIRLPAGALHHSRDLNRLLMAAVVNRKFCSLLLSDPLQAVTNGYNGETFELTPEEVQLLRAIKASSLRDFVLQLLTESLVHENSWSEAQSTVALNKIYATL